MRMPKDNVMIKCPFHEDTNPSFLVRGSFGYCFGCGAREDVIALCCRKYGHTFTSAIDFLLSEDLQMELRHA